MKALKEAIGLYHLYRRWNPRRVAFKAAWRHVTRSSK